jgi:hypothetical protein
MAVKTILLSAALGWPAYWENLFMIKMLFYFYVRHLRLWN